MYFKIIGGGTVDGDTDEQILKLSKRYTGVYL